MLKGKDAPPLYWSPIPVLNLTTNALEEVSFPFLLPHEFFARIVAKKDRSELMGARIWYCANRWAKLANR